MNKVNFHLEFRDNCNILIGRALWNLKDVLGMFRDCGRSCTLEKKILFLKSARSKVRTS